VPAARKTSRVMIEFERLLLEGKPDLVELLEGIAFTKGTINGHYAKIQR